MKVLRLRFLTLVASGLTSLAFAGPQVTLNSLGGFTFKFADHTFTARTRLSAPNGAWVDSLGEASVIGNVVTWNTPQFKITRTVSACQGRIQVEDRIINQSDEVAGLMYQNSVSGDVPASNTYLAGNPVSGDAGRYNPANPTVFANYGTTGLGVVAEGDLLRAQGLVAANSKYGLQLLNNNLGLRPKCRVTLTWSIYLTGSGDFWDFVNTVRRDWDVNFKLKGAFSYEPGNFTTSEQASPKPAEVYAGWAKERGLAYVTSRFIKFDDGSNALGTATTQATKSLAATLSWMGKLGTAPLGGGKGDDGGDDDGDDDGHGDNGNGGGCREHHDKHTSALMFFHGQITTEADADTKYADCRAYDSQGNPINYKSTQYYPLFIPSQDNSYGKALKGTVDTLLKLRAVGGLYWDEMSFSYPELASRGFVYNKGWDGVSVDIDPVTHAVTGKKVCVALATQWFQLDVLRAVKKAHKTIVANTLPFTQTLTNVHIPRFVEAKSGDIASTQLSSPLVLSNASVEWTPADAIANAVNIVNQGALYFGWVERWTPNKPDFIQLSYPLTPTDLRPGVITGRERIVTTRTGNYGFRNKCAYVLVFDNQAVGTVKCLKPTKSHDKYLYHVEVPAGGLAILIRK